MHDSKLEFNMSGLKRYALLLTALLAVLTATAQSDTTAVVATTPAVQVELEAETPEGLWDQANTAYINNDYATAEQTYRAILERGLVSAKLYYNLANACFKQNELGEAILYYHRALRLVPGDEDMRYNLSVAEARTKDTIEELPVFFLSAWMQQVRQLMSAQAWTIWSLVALVVMFAMLLFYLLARRLALRKTGFFGMVAALLLFVLFTAFAAGQRREAVGEERAVVMASSAAVKSSPDRASTDLFVLHEGTTVRVLNRLGDWCEISIADGKKGWTEWRKIEVI